MTGFGDFLGGLAGLPFRLANIPFSVFEELADRVDPHDDTGIASLAEAMATPLGVTADVVEKGIREALARSEEP